MCKKQVSAAGDSRRRFCSKKKDAAELCSVSLIKESKV